MARVSGWFLLLWLPLLAACTGFRNIGAEVYRSRQPGEDQLARHIDTYNIKTVVCLRGDGDGQAASARASLAAGVKFEQVRMSARRLPEPETLLAIWRCAGEAPRPMLLHCRAGVDRTGLACALVVLHDTGDLELARDELSLLNGHSRWFGTGAMDEVLDRYEPYAERMAFPDWVRDVYAPELAAARR